VSYYDEDDDERYELAVQLALQIIKEA